MPIRLFDSLSREVRDLKPSHPDGVFRFYNCGLTVYAAAHIGNFRTFIVNDILRRLLIAEFGEGKVRYVRNLTDVDDKTIRRSREEKRSLGEVTREWTAKFHADCEALNCLPIPTEFEPRAADPRFITEQVNMIEVLMEKGNAYRTPDGSVYFKVASFPGYGALSRLHERELKPGTGFAADADEKEDGSDFALWKSWKEDDGPNKWPGPRGASEGRPGWHIECSAMSKALLGETIDLHTGGVDLLFPHHENEIAQSQCCNGAPLSRHWFHSEHLLVDGKKMSKSLGNYYTLADLTARGCAPLAVRYALLAGHPRKQLNFTLDSLHAAESALTTLHSYWQALGDSGRDDAFAGVLAILRDDLNVPSALGALFTIVHQGPAGISKRSFEKVLDILGLQRELPPKAKAGVPPAVATLAEKRWTAKKAKDFKAADALRAELSAMGWSMLDGKDGYKLESLQKSP